MTVSPCTDLVFGGRHAPLRHKGLFEATVELLLPQYASASQALGWSNVTLEPVCLLRRLLHQRWSSPSWRGMFARRGSSIQLMVCANLERLQTRDRRSRHFPLVHSFSHTLLDLHMSTANDSVMPLLLGLWPEVRPAGHVCCVPASDQPTIGTLHSNGFRTTSCHGIESNRTVSTSSAPRGVQLRHASEDDDSSLVDMHLRELKHHLRYDPFRRITDDTATLFANLLAKKRSQGRLVAILAEDGGHPIAALVGWPRSPAEAHDGLYPYASEHGYYDSLLVQEDYRRRGIASALVHNGHLRFSAMGVDEIRVNFLPSNPAASCFWPARGFSVSFVTLQWRSESVS